MIELPRIVFAGPEFPAAREYLTAALPGASITCVADDPHWPEHAAAEVLVPLMARVDAAFIARIEGLRLIQQWGAGLEGVDRATATAQRIAVGNVPSTESGNADSVAEWCVMAALALSRRLRRLETEIRSGSSWGGPIGRSLSGKTAGIVGLGGIGTALAHRLEAFGMDLVAITRRPSAVRAAQCRLRWLKGPEALPELLTSSDYVFLCLPLTTDTSHLINAAALKTMRENACLINAGRGGLIDEMALSRALEEGRLAGVGLDVFASEPLPAEHELLGHEVVLATPHIAGVTDASYTGIAERLADVVL